MRSCFVVFVIILSALMSCKNEKGLIEDLMEQSGKFKTILKNPDQYRIQIIYTQIDRDAKNKASFMTHKFRVNTDEYFYPASSIKMPMAALALEKLNELNIQGLTRFSDMKIDSAFSGQSSVKYDSSSQSGKPSLEHYIKKIFLVSDNDAYNRLYEFVGQKEANERLHKKGYHDIRITHRLSIPLTIEQNRCTNPMSFYNGDSVIYEQDMKCNQSEIKSESPIFIGKGYMKDSELIQEPMEFTYKNAIGLQSLHDILLSIVFPQYFMLNQQFNLSKNDYDFLYQYMSMYPRESNYPYYGSKYEDGYCKFMMYGGEGKDLGEKIRIYNKVGEAYGFLIDIAYIVDFDQKIEFVLGAVIYVNENEILNDGQYEYETTGYPFMRDLGRIFYEYELGRNRENSPDLRCCLDQIPA